MKVGSTHKTLNFQLEEKDFITGTVRLIVERVKDKFFQEARKSKIPLKEEHLHDFPTNLLDLHKYSLVLDVPDRLVMFDNNEDSVKAYQKYMKVANILKDDPLVDEFLGLAGSIRAKASMSIFGFQKESLTPKELELSLPFISIVAPQGSGKTQFIFTIGKRLPSGCIRLVSPKLHTHINWWNRSLHCRFFKVLEEDRKILANKKSFKMYSCEIFLEPEIFDLKLVSIGFTVALLALVAKTEYAKNLYKTKNVKDLPKLEKLEEFLYFPMSYKDALIELQKFQNTTPFVFLDDFLVSDTIDYEFARNLFRALGVVCVTVGTKPMATQLLPRTKSMVKNDWTYLWYKLPSPKYEAFLISKDLREELKLLEESPKFSDFFKWIRKVPCPNPRMYERFIGALCRVITREKLDLKSAKACDLFLELIHTGNYMCSSRDEGCTGQVAVNFKSWRNPNETFSHLRQPFLVDRHYANVNVQSDTSYVLLELQNNQLLLNGKSWSPTSIYPEIANNELFYLFLINYKIEHHFAVNEKKTAVDAFRTYLKLLSAENQNLDDLEGFSKKNICHLAVMISSRLHFSNGIRVSTLIQMLVANFDTSTNDMWYCYRLDYAPRSLFWRTLFPYLAPMDAKLSEEFMNLPGLYIRSLSSDRSVVTRKADSKEPIFVFEMDSVFDHLSFATDVEGGKSVLSIVKRAWENHFEGVDDKEISEFLFIFAKSITPIDNISSECAEIADVLSCRHVLFHQIRLFGRYSLDILPRPVFQRWRKRNKKTLNVILFSFAHIYAEDYDLLSESLYTAVERPEAGFWKVERFPKIRNAPISPVVRKRKRARRN